MNQNQNQNQKKVNLHDDTLEIKQLKAHITSKSVLSNEEVLWLFRKHHDKRTDADIQKLVDSNLAMVYSLSVQYLTRHQNINNKFKINFMDVFNSGVIGLHKAIEKFDSIRELKFSTYAYFYIANEIRLEIRRHIYPLKTYNYHKVSRAPSTDVVEQTIDPSQDNDLKYSTLTKTMKTVLTKQQSTIFDLFFIKEVDVVAIAKTLNLSKSACYYHISNIKKKIKSELPELRLDLKNK